MTDYYTLLPGEAFGTAEFLDEIRGNLAGTLMHATGPVELAEPFHWRIAPHVPVTDWLIGLRPALLLSSRFRRVLDDNLGPRDHIQWIKSEVELPDATKASYWSPHFPDPVDVLDEVRTQRGPGGVPMLWFLSRQKLNEIRVTPVPMMGATLVVDAGIVQELRRLRLTGFDTLRSRVTH